MSDSDLSIILFLVGLGINFGVAGVAQAGWKHPFLIGGLFVAGLVLCVAGITWPWIKGLSPAVTLIVREVATNSVSWFVVIILSLISILLPRRMDPKPIDLQLVDLPQPIETFVRLQFQPNSVTPVCLGLANIRSWFALCNIITITGFDPLTGKPQEMVERVWSLFLLFEKPTAIKQIIFDSHGFAMPLSEVKHQSDRHAIISINGDMGGATLDVRAIV